MHKSLLKIDIFYRDISIDNIMFIKNKENDFLIDLDFIIKINDNYVFDVSSKIKIKVFIIIDALLNESYNVIHNLKSFF